MNRKNLTAAVLAGLAGAAGIVGSAQAVNINPDGLGEVLIYPYYTTNAGNSTLLSVVNTSEDAKAVKVRFLEGKNSREVLDFNLYLSPYDVWTASLWDDDGTPTMTTGDNSCTVPYIYGDFGGMQAFLPYGMNDVDPGDDTVLGDMSRATEGHFEMIEMGTLTDEDMGSATAITHVGGLLPEGGCAQLVAAWTDPDDTVEDDEGYWLMNPSYDMAPPSGGLFGGAAVVHVSSGTMYSYDAKAINGFSWSQMHDVPGNTSPNLNSGDRNTGYVFLDNGNLFGFEFEERTVDAVSYVFMHDQLMNEWTNELAVGGNTEWVVTFPTKHFYVYQPNSGSVDPVPPFTSTWNGDYEERPQTACEVILLDTIWDRNEVSPGTPDDPTGDPIPPIVSPAPPPTDPNDPDPIVPFEICYETNVIAFGDGSILGSSSLHSINTDTEFFSAETGWMRLQMDDYPYDENGDGMIDEEESELSREALGNLEGLPVTGFAIQRFENQFVGEAENKVANYGGIFSHKASRKLGSQYY